MIVRRPADYYSPDLYTAGRVNAHQSHHDIHTDRDDTGATSTVHRDDCWACQAFGRWTA